MAITRTEFKDETYKVYRGASIKILGFLRENKDSAYTSKEIAEAVGISQTSVVAAMKKLVQSGDIENKKPYYISVSDTAKYKNKRKLLKGETGETGETASDNDDDENDKDNDEDEDESEDKKDE